MILRNKAGMMGRTALHIVVDYLVVGGGGNGGASASSTTPGCGGGGGGVIFGTTSFKIAQYTIFAGSGAQNSQIIGPGVNVIAFAGGAGGNASIPGSNGGAGGGGYLAGQQGLGTPGQGYDGEGGGTLSGGGAGHSGGPLGGAGLASSITGTQLFYGGGGGGGVFGNNADAIGWGGGAGFTSTGARTGNQTGGNGGNVTGGVAQPGTAGLIGGGGGGGGSCYRSSDGSRFNSTQGGPGGPGIVILRYQSNVTKATGGAISFKSINGGNYVLHQFDINQGGNAFAFNIFSA